jgi:hypothetical protein
MLVAGHGDAAQSPPAPGGGVGTRSVSTVLAVLVSLFVAMLQELKLFIVHNPAIMRVVHHANTSLSSINELFFKVFFKIRASELVKQAQAQLRAKEEASTSSAAIGQGTIRLVVPSALRGTRPMSWGTRPVPSMRSPELLSEIARHPATQEWQTTRASRLSDTATAPAQRAVAAISGALGEVNAAGAALRGTVLAREAEARRQQLAGEELRRKEMQDDIVRNINTLLDAAAVPEVLEEEGMGGCDSLLSEQEQEVCVCMHVCERVSVQKYTHTMLSAGAFDGCAA